MLRSEASARQDNPTRSNLTLDAMNLPTWHLAPRSLIQGAGNRNTLARHDLTVPDRRAYPRVYAERTIGSKTQPQALARLQAGRTCSSKIDAHLGPCLSRILVRRPRGRSGQREAENDVLRGDWRS